ncbi:MAG: hypothetical protein ACH255_08760 [Candidatus Thiodiazotropha sp.]
MTTLADLLLIAAIPDKIYTTIAESVDSVSITITQQTVTLVDKRIGKTTEKLKPGTNKIRY